MVAGTPQIDVFRPGPVRILRSNPEALFLSGDSQNHNALKHGPYVRYPGQTLYATWHIYRTGSVPGAPGARRGGPKIAQNMRARLYLFIFPKRVLQLGHVVAQSVFTQATLS